MKNFSLIIFYFVLFVGYFFSLKGQTQNTWTKLPPPPIVTASVYDGLSMNGKAYYLYPNNDIMETWEFNPSGGGIWTRKTNFPGDPTIYRGNGSYFSIGTKGYFLPQYDAVHYSGVTEFYEYDAIYDRWARKTDFTLDPSNPHPEATVTFVINGKGYMGTGGSGGVSSNSFYMFDPSDISAGYDNYGNPKGTWSYSAPIPGVPLSYGVSFVINNKAYVGLGDPTHTDKTFYEFDPSVGPQGTWTAKTPYPGNGWQWATGFSSCNRGYVGKANDNLLTGPYYNDFWEFNPAGAGSWVPVASYPGAYQSYASMGITIGNATYVGILTTTDFWKYVPPLQITTETVSMGQTTFCAGSTVSIPITACPDFNPGNYFTIQLSDASGSFANPTILGTYYGTSSTVFNVTLPYNLPEGSGYRVRVVSSSPVVTGTANPTNLTIQGFEQWTQRKDMTPRANAIAFAIGDKGYVGLGDNNNTYLNDLWQWDQNNVWTQMANYAGGVKTSATAFSIGNIGYVGTGASSSTTFVNYFYEWRQSLNRWAPKQSVPGVARISAVGYSIGSKGYIGTGQDINGTTLNDFYIYDPASPINGNDPFGNPMGAWTRKADVPTTRTEATGFSIGTKGYISTGKNGSTFLSDLWEYESNSASPFYNTWVRKADVPTEGRMAAVSFAFQNKGYLGTGLFTGLKCTKDFYEYDPSDLSNGTDVNGNPKGKWNRKADLGGVARYAAAGFSTSNNGFIGFGIFTPGIGIANPKTYLSDFWEYYPGSCNSVNFISLNQLNLGNSCAIPGDLISIPYAAYGNYDAANVFTVQLSDASGSFSNPTVLGTNSSNGSGIINAVWPSGMIGIFKVRVVSSNPATISNETSLCLANTCTSFGLIPKIVASDGTVAHQGYSVSISDDGNTLIEGGYSDASNKGAAWIYVNSGGAWVKQAKLAATDATAGSKMGISVALSPDGNIAVVGGREDNSVMGAIWVYKRTGTSWGTGVKLVGTGSVGTSPNQGTSVAISGDGLTILSGGFLDNAGVGAVWVWKWNGTAYVQEAKLIGANTNSGGNQGISVSLSNDGLTAAIGGSSDDLSNHRGAVWIWTSNGLGTWTQIQKFQGDPNMALGVSVSISKDGNTIAAGGQGVASNTGTAFIYVKSGATYIQQTNFVANDALSGTCFGNKISLSGDGNNLLVGGLLNNSGVGAVWLYNKSGSSWTQQGKKIVARDVSGAANFGSSVALSLYGKVAVIGGPNDNSNAGAFWVLGCLDQNIKCTSFNQSTSAKIVASDAYVAKQGTSAISADGSTIIIGGANDNLGIGGAWIYVKNSAGWNEQAKLVANNSVGPGSSLGGAVAISTDGNTVVVGGSQDNSGIGAVWIFTRSGLTWIQGQKLIGSGYSGTPNFGSSIAISGDGNTILVGGFIDGNNLGAAWVFTKSGSTWSQQGTKLIGSHTTNGYQGNSVNLSYDGNTAVIGGFEDMNTTHNGAAWVWTRTGTTWTEQFKISGNTSMALGSGVSVSDDGNTIAVGAQRDNNYTGTVWIYIRSAGVWTQQATLIGTGAAAGSYFGNEVSLSPDGNNLLVGGLMDNGSKGAVWAYTRSGAVWTAQGSKISPADIIGNGQFGGAVSLSRYGEIAVVGGSTDNTNIGATWVYECGAATNARMGMLLNNPQTNDASSVFSLYPNPNNGTFNIDISNEEREEGNFTVINNLGQVIYSGEIKGQEKISSVLSLGQYSAGLYCFSLRLKNKIFSKSFIIDK